MQLEKADHGRLIAALDALMLFVGLWQGFQLGAMNRIKQAGAYDELFDRYGVLKMPEPQFALSGPGPG